MKKLITLLTVICLLTAAVAAFAENPDAPFTLRDGITFGMAPDEVIAVEGNRGCEWETERTRAFTFTTLEYEHAMDHGTPCELRFFFLDNALVAVKGSLETRDASYEKILADLTGFLGEPAPLDPAELGNAVYAVDDDGRPEYGALVFTSGTVKAVLERDGDDIEVTFLDMASALAR
ncbi:MAG: hypothetical protein IKS31_08445 [Clostridia bacterium]|nr:hypothetical protein [Clostridia bacterium]